MHDEIELSRSYDPPDESGRSYNGYGAMPMSAPSAFGLAFVAGFLAPRIPRWAWWASGGLLAALALVTKRQAVATTASAAIETGERIVRAIKGNPFADEFARAVAHVGAPADWAESPDLLALVQHESNWDPTAKNSGSTAYGLFQFIKSTWGQFLPEVPYGTADAFWQIVGGLRYIKATYRTPERAWAFWQATKQKIADLAPVDLRSKAAYWIANNWAGY